MTLVAVEFATLAAAHARLTELENEVKIMRKPPRKWRRPCPPRVRYRFVVELAVDDVPVK